MERYLPTLPDGTKRSLLFDDKGNVIAKFETPKDLIGQALDNNAAARNHTTGKTRSGDMVRAASIPASVGLKWFIEEGWWFQDPDNSERLMKKLNDPDWAYLRTGGGQLAMNHTGGFR